jgi:hypothetical protein
MQGKIRRQRNPLFSTTLEDKAFPTKLEDKAYAWVMREIRD